MAIHGRTIQGHVPEVAPGTPSVRLEPRTRVELRFFARPAAGFTWFEQRAHAINSFPLGTPTLRPPMHHFMHQSHGPLLPYPGSENEGVVVSHTSARCHWPPMFLSPALSVTFVSLVGKPQNTGIGTRPVRSRRSPRRSSPGCTASLSCTCARCFTKSRRLSSSTGSTMRRTADLPLRRSIHDVPTVRFDVPPMTCDASRRRPRSARTRLTTV